VSELARLLRERQEQVGILAVDPSSPFTGGAILGDRIRMQTHQGDPGVFIRSMASRGSLGGLATATYEASEVLEAAGASWILFETVGVGQSELEIIEAADTTVLVLVPESGDGVQVMKAGLMEAGDIFVINKCDREGGDRLHKEISLMIELGHERWRTGGSAGKGRGLDRGQGLTSQGGDSGWERRICKTVALRGEGIDDLLAAIEAHRDLVRSDPRGWSARQEQRIASRLRTQLRDRLLHGLWEAGHIEEWVADGMRRIRGGEVSPYGLVDELVGRLLPAGRGSGVEAAEGGDR
jgi:LAO/AO transport system kinase